MPLRYLLDQLGLSLRTRKLALPMQVHLRNGLVINKYESLEAWILEAERTFGHKNQRQFWELCYSISQFVWDTSIQQLFFPPTSINDLAQCIKHATISQAWHARYAFMSMGQLLRKYGLHHNKLFVEFVNEQLLITAQNHMEEVNVLFGATALCYTNYGNHYLDGGMINLVTPLMDYIESKGGEVLLRSPVQQITLDQNGYTLLTKNGKWQAKYLVSGIPLNNTIQVYNGKYAEKLEPKLMGSPQLNSAFQMGIGFQPSREFNTIHYQIHLDDPLPETGSLSIFVSLSHPEDNSRSDIAGMMVASVSTHIPDPGSRIVDSDKAEVAVIDVLVAKKILKREDIVYRHSATAKAWEKWTGRTFGFVGGYPQYMKIKPWQMQDARLDGHKAYIVGDTVYPGQGIPGTTLSGIIAYEKLVADWL